MRLVRAATGRSGGRVRPSPHKNVDNIMRLGHASENYGVFSMADAQRVTISLPAQMVADMKAAVEAGEFASNSDYVRHHLRMAQAETSRAAVQAAIAEGIAQIERGEGIPAQDVVNELEKTARRRSNADRAASRAEALHAE